MDTRTDYSIDDVWSARPRKEYPTRQIYAHARYINCQILNWDDGPPPKYLVCNPLHKDYREPFLAKQALGTWMKVDLRDALLDIQSAFQIIADFELPRDIHPSTQHRMMREALAAVQSLARAMLPQQPVPANERVRTLAAQSGMPTKEK